MARPNILTTSVVAALILLFSAGTVLYLAHWNVSLASLAPSLFNHGCQCPSPTHDEDWAKTFRPKAFERIPQFERPSDSVPLLDDDLLPPSASALLEEISLPAVQFLRVDGKERWYGISMLHQLHCLHMLKAVLFGEGMHTHSRRSLEDGDDSEDSEHWTHCLSYIAQALVCAADDTIETYEVRELETGEKVAVVNGLGGIHQCRDSSLIRNAVAQSQIDPIQSWHYRNGDTLSSVLARRRSANGTDQ